jgi:hypothetical protein
MFECPHASYLAEICIAALFAYETESEIQAMCATIMDVSVDAKKRRPAISRALYLPTAAVDGDEIVKEGSVCSVAAPHASVTAP